MNLKRSTTILVIVILVLSSLTFVDTVSASDDDLEPQPEIDVYHQDGIHNILMIGMQLRVKQRLLHLKILWI